MSIKFSPISGGKTFSRKSARSHGLTEDLYREKHTRLNDSKMPEEMYRDSTTYLEKVPRVEPEALFTILEFMGKKGVPLENVADNSIVDRLVKEGFVEKLYKKR